jgi:bifunctional UDP-N-acetylglucosamine pyrophosphorylase/glucosamine-1-phosphate N-acetyltransferase
MVTNISYYFSDLSKFPFKDFFDGMEHPWEPLFKVKSFLNELLVKPDLKVLKSKPLGTIDLYGNYFIDEGSVIYNGVTIIGPVYIGKNVEIMPGAIIRPNTIIGDNCVLGHCAEVKHCVVLNGAKIQSTSFAGDCVIGASARIGSGAITANRKFDQSIVTIKFEKEKISLGTDYFGCVLGDNSRLGANAVTQPGTHIGRHTWIYPATNVRGFIPSQKRVYQERPLTMEENEIHNLKP